MSLFPDWVKLILNPPNNYSQQPKHYEEQNQIQTLTITEILTPIVSEIISFMWWFSNHECKVIFREYG